MSEQNPILKNQKTNWKFLLIVIILSVFVAGFSIYYSLLTQKEIKEETPISFSKISPKKEERKQGEEKQIELSLDELKEGENKIGNVILEKIEPKKLCYSGDFTRGEFSGEVKKIKSRKDEYEKDEYELTCNIKNKAKVKIVGFGDGTFDVTYVTVLDKNNNIIVETKRVDVEELEEKIGTFDIFLAQVKIFEYNYKTYFLLFRGDYVGKIASIERNFLYVIDKGENVKNISSWQCSPSYGRYCPLIFGIGYKNNLFFKVGKEIWELGEDDTIKNKFPANKIIIKDSEISFR